MKLKKGIYPNGIQLFTFVHKQMNDFFWHEGCIDFKWNLSDGNLIKKYVYREFDFLVFTVKGISLRKGFWVVNTWRAPVRKLFKQSTLNFAHTFLTGC